VSGYLDRSNLVTRRWRRRGIPGRDWAAPGGESQVEKARNPAHQPSGWLPGPLLRATARRASIVRQLGLRVKCWSVVLWTRPGP